MGSCSRSPTSSGLCSNSTLFFAGLVFALLMLLHFSVRISLLERRVTMLIQEIGLMTVQAAEDEPAGQDEDAVQCGLTPGSSSILQRLVCVRKHCKRGPTTRSVMTPPR